MWIEDHYHPLVGVLHFISHLEKKTPCDRLTIVCLQVSMFVCESRFELNCC